MDGNELAILRGASRAIANGIVQSLSVELDWADDTTRGKIIDLLDTAGFDLGGFASSPLYPSTTVGNAQFTRRAQAVKAA